MHAWDCQQLSGRCSTRVARTRVSSERVAADVTGRVVDRSATTIIRVRQRCASKDDSRLGVRRRCAATITSSERRSQASARGRRAPRAQAAPRPPCGARGHRQPMKWRRADERDGCPRWFAGRSVTLQPRIRKRDRDGERESQRRSARARLSRVTADRVVRTESCAPANIIPSAEARSRRHGFRNVNQSRDGVCASFVRHHAAQFSRRQKLQDAGGRRHRGMRGIAPGGKGVGLRLVDEIDARHGQPGVLG